MIDETSQNGSTPKISDMPKREDIISFKSPGRILELADVEAEFALMKSFLKAEKPLDAIVAKRICEKCGTHLVKLVSPRADGDQSTLFIKSKSKNENPRLTPSVNGPDIPFAKIIFRPLEVKDHKTMTLVDHVMNPIDISGQVTAAFKRVFGEDVMNTVSLCLGNPKDVTSLASGEFPIIFIPSPKGGDIQVTPLAPAAAYMGMKDAISPYFQPQIKGEPKVPRGRFHTQIVSSKMQNISGAIGGPRRRLLAVMPTVMDASEAELYRFIQGGSFPRWRDPEVSVWIMKYADLLDRHKTYNDKNTRRGLDGFAGKLIEGANLFIIETINDAQTMVTDDQKVPKAPGIDRVLLRRFWAGNTFDRARRALASDHMQGLIYNFKTDVES